MPARSLSAIDMDLSEAVKARAAATKTISQLSQAVVYNTKLIDQLLAERAALTCPDSLELLIGLVQPTPAKPKAG